MSERTVPYEKLSPIGKVRFHVEQIEETVSSITFPVSGSRAEIRRQLDGILAALDEQQQADFDESFGTALGRLLGEGYERKVMEWLSELEAIVRSLATAPTNQATPVVLDRARERAKAWVEANPEADG